MRLTSIGGGADEVMLGIISKYMGTLPVPAKKKKPAAATTAVEQGTATAKGTVHPGLRLVSSGNFFLALNRSHHFFKKKAEFNKAT